MIVLVSLDQELTLASTGQIAALSVGQLLQVGTPRTLYDHARSRSIADYLRAITVSGGRVAPRVGSGISDGRATDGRGGVPIH